MEGVSLWLRRVGFVYLVSWFPFLSAECQMYTQGWHPCDLRYPDTRIFTHDTPNTFPFQRKPPLQFEPSCLRIKCLDSPSKKLKFVLCVCALLSPLKVRRRPLSPSRRSGARSSRHCAAPLSCRSCLQLPIEKYPLEVITINRTRNRSVVGSIACLMPRYKGGGVGHYPPYYPNMTPPSSR